MTFMDNMAAISRRKEAHAANVAAKALKLGLAGMTQLRWSLLTPSEKVNLRDNSCLTPQLNGYDNCRVEVIDKHGERRQFWVGQSTGWRPVHLEIKRSNSKGGTPADRDYQSVLLVVSMNGRRYVK